jgi:putative transposase
MSAAFARTSIMARMRRWFVPGISTHIIKRGNNRAAVFSSTADYHQFLRLVQGAMERHAAAVHAFALMANHIHLIATPSVSTSIPAFMKDLGERYSVYFNATYSRIGTPWSGRYKALLLTDERYWLTCLRYVELNPVRAKIVVNADDYEWSSYSSHALGRPHEWLRPHPVFESLGQSRAERAEVYRRLCDAPLTEDDVRRIRTPPRNPALIARDTGSDPGV